MFAPAAARAVRGRAVHGHLDRSQGAADDHAGRRSEPGRSDDPAARQLPPAGGADELGAEHRLGRAWPVRRSRQVSGTLNSSVADFGADRGRAVHAARPRSAPTSSSQDAAQSA